MSSKLPGLTAETTDAELMGMALRAELIALISLYNDGATKHHNMFIVGAWCDSPEGRKNREAGIYEELANAKNGLRSEWQHPYDDIACGKLRISRRTGRDSRVVHEEHPHELIDGDPPYWGSKVGLITMRTSAKSAIQRLAGVGASGVQSHIDEALCGGALAKFQALVELRDKLRYNLAA